MGIDAASKNGLEIAIVFQVKEKNDADDVYGYAPMQEAVIGLLIIYSLSEFLKSENWNTAQLEMKDQVSVRWRVIGKSIPIYFKNTKSSTIIGQFERGVF